MRSLKCCIKSCCVQDINAITAAVTETETTLTLIRWETEEGKLWHPPFPYPPLPNTHKPQIILLVWLAQSSALRLRQQWAGWAGQELLLWLPFLGSLSQPRKTVSLSCTLDRRRERERKSERRRDTKRENEVERGDKDRKKRRQKGRGYSSRRPAMHLNTHIIKICTHLCSSVPPLFFLPFPSVSRALVFTLIGKQLQCQQIMLGNIR